MPTNLPPEYYEAERRYREAQSHPDRIAALEDLLSTIPKHKGTDRLRADLRGKLAELRRSARPRRGSRRRTSPYSISPDGAGQVMMLGPPNGGRSTLLNRLTSAHSETSAAPFTTYEPIAGMVAIEDIQVQLIDTPSIVSEYVDPELLHLLRRCDLALIVVDLPLDPEREIESLLQILGDHDIALIPPGDGAPDKAQGFPALVVANKCDDPSLDELCPLVVVLIDDALPVVGVSAMTGYRLGDLLRAILESLRIVRVYTKAPGREIDRSAPFVLREGGTVADMAALVHRDFYERLKTARIWGTGVYDGQLVGREHVLHDGDIVELHL